MLSINTSSDFQLICFTDNAEEIDKQVETYPLPELGCKIPKTVPGKFPKIALWGNDLPIEKGPVLFIDLDTVIIDNIDDYFKIGDPNDVYLAKNWTKPFTGLGQTSVFRFPVGGHPYILEDLRANTRKLAEKYRYEQHYVTKNVTPKVKFWPNHWTKHYRIHCLGFWPLRYFRKPIKPKGSKIITFPGLPDPNNAIHGKMNDGYPKTDSSFKYFKACFTHPTLKRKPFKSLKRYVPKSDWLDEAWDVLK